MDANSIPTAPEGEKVSAHDVRELDHGVENMLGPVKVGCFYSSECFGVGMGYRKEDIDEP